MIFVFITASWNNHYLDQFIEFSSDNLGSNKYFCWSILQKHT